MLNIHPPKAPRIASIVACTDQHLPHQIEHKSKQLRSSLSQMKVNNFSPIQVPLNINNILINI